MNKEKPCNVLLLQDMHFVHSFESKITVGES